MTDLYCKLLDFVKKVRAFLFPIPATHLIHVPMYVNSHMLLPTSALVSIIMVFSTCCKYSGLANTAEDNEIAYQEAINALLEPLLVRSLRISCYVGNISVCSGDSEGIYSAA